eukprot:SAG22_NODE_664_length_8022_cov_2.639576_8_plen_409_part_00
MFDIAGRLISGGEVGDLSTYCACRSVLSESAASSAREECGSDGDGGGGGGGGLGDCDCSCYTDIPDVRSFAGDKFAYAGFGDVYCASDVWMDSLCCGDRQACESDENCHYDGCGNPTEGGLWSDRGILNFSAPTCPGPGFERDGIAYQEGFCQQHYEFWDEGASYSTLVQCGRPTMSNETRFDLESVDWAETFTHCPTWNVTSVAAGCIDSPECERDFTIAETIAICTEFNDPNRRCSAMPVAQYFFGPICAEIGSVGSPTSSWGTGSCEVHADCIYEGCSGAGDTRELDTWLGTHCSGADADDPRDCRADPGQCICLHRHNFTGANYTECAPIDPPLNTTGRRQLVESLPSTVATTATAASSHVRARKAVVKQLEELKAQLGAETLEFERKKASLLVDLLGTGGQKV